jgi:Xaa-Pro dipeptidase
MCSGFSLQERDRRWELVRSLAEKAGLDGLLVPLGNGADSRYLTLIRGSVIVIPSDGRDPVVVMDQGQSNDWVPDPIPTVRAWAGPMTGAVRTAGLASGLIGVAGLGPGRWSNATAGDGVVTHGPFAHMLTALPRAVFVDATDVVGQARWVKSEEELEHIRLAAALAETGLAGMRSELTAGKPETLPHATGIREILRSGSEYRAHHITVDGRARPKPGNRLQDGQTVTATFAGSPCGYTCNETETFVVGDHRSEWAALVSAHEHALGQGLKRVSVGATVGEVEEAVLRAGEASDFDVTVDIYGIGIGDDGPVIRGDKSSEAARELKLVDGNALSIDVRVLEPNSARAFRASRSLVVQNGVGSVTSQRRGGLE